MAQKYNTYLWQEVKGEHIYRVQSDDPVIIQKLKKKKNARIIGQGINQYQLTFIVEFDSPKEARKTISGMAGKSVIIDDKSDETHIVTYKHHSRNEQLSLL